MTQTCSTCKWWGFTKEESGTFIYENADGDFITTEYRHKPCHCPKIIYGGRISDEEIDRMADDIAVYSDIESYYAEFSTGPAFGCIHHETKEFVT